MKHSLLARPIQAIGFSLLISFTSFAAAQGASNAPVSLVVPFAPGGSVDLVARAVSEPLAKELKSTVVVDNRPGASGSLGALHTIRSTPNGKTLLLGSTSTISVRPLLEPPPGYDPAKDLTPLNLTAGVPHVIVANPSVPASNIKELIALAKSSKDSLSWGDSGPGTPHHLAGQLLAREAGIDLLFVAYRGTSAVVTDLVAGHVQVSSVEMGVALPYIQNGRLKVLGISSLERNKALPDVPTVSEQGVEGYNIQSWFGFFAPSQTPAAQVKELTDALKAAVSSEQAIQALNQSGLEAINQSGPEFQEFLKREHAKWSRAIGK
ncbi:tripartite tricarboxylate transporter substrate binding protein [Alcaligenaceae bacterium]|nr:tripartite tricarboxylate transporter substrate binding protein [Alcaligenaceae bacterium]